MDDYQPGKYVYFGGNQRRFRIRRLLPNRELELEMGLDRRSGTTRTRIVHIDKDEVTTAPTDLGVLRPSGFFPEFQGDAHPR